MSPNLHITVTIHLKLTFPMAFYIDGFGKLWPAITSVNEPNFNGSKCAKCMNIQMKWTCMENMKWKKERKKNGTHKKCNERD